MSIPFIQYLLPDGRQRAIEIDRPPEIEDIAHRFIESGGKFEIELLTTGHASITAVKEVNGEEGDVAIEVCANAPGAVPAAVDRVVMASARFTGAES